MSYIDFPESMMLARAEPKNVTALAAGSTDNSLGVKRKKTGLYHLMADTASPLGYQDRALEGCVTLSQHARLSQHHAVVCVLAGFATAAVVKVAQDALKRSLRLEP